MYFYLLPFVIFWLIGGFLWYYFGYNESFLLLNRHYFDLGDAFFPHFTHLADGVLLSCLFGFFVIKKDKPLIITMIIALLMVAQVISYLKYRVFLGYDRPFIELGEKAIHYVTIEGEKYVSFPSGHSAAAAAMGFFFAFFHRNDKRWIGLLWAICMILLCYSRIYIGVHFLADTVVGSAIGVGIAGFCVALIYPRLTQYFSQKSPEFRQKTRAFLYGLAILVLLFDFWRIAVEIYGVGE